MQFENFNRNTLVFGLLLSLLGCSAGPSKGQRFIDDGLVQSRNGTKNGGSSVQSNDELEKKAPSSETQPSQGKPEVRFLGLTAPVNLISSAYSQPDSKQGTFDLRTEMTDLDRGKRYENLKKIGIGYRQYNILWEEWEHQTIPSSLTPINCPVDYVSFPLNEEEKTLIGSNKFRCIRTKKLWNFDATLTQDGRAGFQSGVIISATPAAYRHKDCQGTVVNGVLLKQGCLPKQESLEDFQDFVTLLAGRYSKKFKGLEDANLQHFIIWNDFPSSDKADLSPVVGRKYDAQSIEKKLDYYAASLKLAHTAIAKFRDNAVLYASIGRVWKSTPENYQNGEMGAEKLLTGLWKRLGNNISWSIAINPSGDPSVTLTDENYYHFSSLKNIYDFQLTKAAELGLNIQTIPQRLMLAVGQGWKSSEGAQKLARNICAAHSHSLNYPYLISQAHNYFQSVEPDKNVGATTQPDSFGLFSFETPNSLDNFLDTAVGAAYAATRNDLFKKSDTHACCKQDSIGCGSAELTRYWNNGVVDHFTDISEPPNAMYLKSKVMGRVYTTADALRHTLYGCKDGKDYFLSTASTCDGKTVLKTIGYISKKSQPLHTEMFSCLFLNSDGTQSTNKFPSLEAECEGHKKLGSLGFIRNTEVP
jgi:hypothetical protein